MLNMRSRVMQRQTPTTLVALLLIAGILLLLVACGSDASSGGSDDRQKRTLMAATTATTPGTTSTVSVATTAAPTSTTIATTTTTTMVVPGPLKGFDTRSIIRQLSVADDLVVAVGSACEGPNVDRGLCVGAIWTTADAVTWDRIAHDVSLFGEPEYIDHAFQLIDVAVSDTGFVAVASTESTALFSPDGLTWERVPALEGSRLRHVAAIGHGFVAAGNGIWISRDGRTWRAVNGPQPQSVSHLAVGPDRIVAFSGYNVWSSLLGESWEVWAETVGAEPSAPTSTCLGGPRPREREVGRLLGTPGGFLVTQRSQVWIEGSGVVWTSDDAIVWHRIDLPETDEENSTVTAVAVTEDLYMAFGTKWHLPDSDEGNCPDVVVTGSVAWMSSDAQTWTLIDQPRLDGTARPVGAWFYGDLVLMTFDARSRVVAWTVDTAALSTR